MNRSRKEKLKEQLERLDPQEHTQIFGIIQKYTDKFTKTEQGALVSSDNLSDECLLEIEKLVLFYVDQRKRMDTDATDRKLFDRR
jgi:hypothetical protein